MDKFVFDQHWTSLLFRLRYEHIVQKINLTGWSQVVDTTMSWCIIFQRLHETVLWLQIFSIPEDCFNQITFIILNYYISGFHESPVFDYWPLRRFIPSEEVFRCVLQKPADVYTANQAERQSRKLGALWTKRQWAIGVGFSQPHSFDGKNSVDKFRINSTGADPLR